VLVGISVVGIGIAAALHRASRVDAGVPGVQRIGSVAVTPFENLTGDSGQMYLAKGITDQIETELAQLGSVRVLRLEHGEGSAPVVETASRLGVEAVLSGALQRTGNTVRITARLRGTESGVAIWAESFDGNLSGILQLQADVARAAAGRLRPDQAPGRPRARRKITPAAYEAYVRGLYFRGRATEAGFRRALVYFRKAIEHDPTYAEAYAGLANSYINLGYYGAVAPRDAFPQARAATSQAMQLDSTLADAHLARAHYLFYGDWSFAAAEREFDRAIALDSTSASIHFTKGMYLTAMHRTPEALAELERARDLNPLSTGIQAASARTYYNARRYDEAVSQANVALELDSTFARAHFWLGMSYEQLGRKAEAIRELETAIASGGATSIYVAALGHVYGRSGNRQGALHILRDLRSRASSHYISPLDIATVYLGLGDTEAAFDWLERARETGASALVYLAVDPRYDPLRRDPRFVALLERIGFPPQVIAANQQTS
jgi:TolB-like protein/tetratricopeptide (TPR) repeat protein